MVFLITRRGQILTENIILAPRFDLFRPCGRPTGGPRLVFTDGIIKVFTHYHNNLTVELKKFNRTGAGRDNFFTVLVPPVVSSVTHNLGSATPSWAAKKSRPPAL